MGDTYGQLLSDISQDESIEHDAKVGFLNRVKQMKAAGIPLKVRDIRGMTEKLGHFSEIGKDHAEKQTIKKLSPDGKSADVLRKSGREHENIKVADGTELKVEINNLLSMQKTSS